MIKLLPLIAALIGLGAALAPTAASAQWVFSDKEDAFSDEVLHIALGTDGRYGLGFRCSGPDDIELLFITPEAASDETIDVMSKLTVNLLVRADDDAVQTFAAQIIATPNGTLAALASDGDIAAFASEVGGASRRVAAAIEVVGERMHSTELRASGSTKAIASLTKACRLE